MKISREKFKESLKGRGKEDFSKDADSWQWFEEIHGVEFAHGQYTGGTRGEIEMNESLNVGTKKPTIRYSKQMKQFLSYLHQIEERNVNFAFKTLDTFGRARKGETLRRNRFFDYAHSDWSLQRMGKTLTEKGLVRRARTGKGYAYNLTPKGRTLVKERKLENFFSFEWKEKEKWEL